MSTVAPGPAARETAVFVAAAAAGLALVGLGTTEESGPLAVGLAVAVAIIGLPHGALDAWIARRAALWRSVRGAIAFHAAYVAAAAAIIAAWPAAPALSLALFLAVSAWHFAGDWPLPSLLRPLVGGALLAFPAWHWPDEVARVFALLGGEGGTAIAQAFAAAGPALAVALAAVVLFSLRRAPLAAVELATLAALAAWLPPLVYFVVYFCALHSPRHFASSVAGIDAAARRRVMGMAALYTALALAGAALAWPWLAEGGTARWPEDTVRLVFIALAALTVPHMIVVGLAERRSRAVP